MSTRANIVIQDEEGTKVILYHHCDGYIEGVGVDLIRYLVSLNKNKGVASYKELLAMLPEDYEETDGIHGDIAYLYTIMFTDTSIKLWVDDRRLYSYKYSNKLESFYLSQDELTEAVSLSDEGNKVGLVESSLARENAVRIYADNPDGKVIKNPDGSDFIMPDCIHVNEEGAKLIIEGLQAWLAHINGEKQ